MNGPNVASFGGVPLAGNVGLNFDTELSRPVAWGRDYAAPLHVPGQVPDHGKFMSFLLSWVLVEAGAVYRRVENHLLGNEPESSMSEYAAVTLVESYSKGFDVVALAGAMVAQVAVSALALPDVAITHWTTTALFLLSLLTGLAAVYYACQVKLALARCQTGKSLLRWLTTPKTNPIVLSIGNITYSGQPAFGSNGYRPSITAAMILTSPPRMLIISVLCIFAGITEYLALRFALNIGTLRGEKANLAVLITVVGASVLVVLHHETSEWLKWLKERIRHSTEGKRRKKLERERGQQTLPRHNTMLGPGVEPSAAPSVNLDVTGNVNVDLAAGGVVWPRFDRDPETLTIRVQSEYEVQRQAEFDTQLLTALQRLLGRSSVADQGPARAQEVRYPDANGHAGFDEAIGTKP